jgi:hypothetical protein
MDVALVDLDYAELDAFRAALADRLAALGEDPGDALRARVRLVLGESATAEAFAWAGLAGVPRAGEAGRLGEVVVDAVLIGARSPRKDAVSRLAAALGARVLVMPERAAQGAREARP